MAVLTNIVDASVTFGANCDATTVVSSTVRKLVSKISGVVGTSMFVDSSSNILKDFSGKLLPTRLLDNTVIT